MATNVTSTSEQPQAFNYVDDETIAKLRNVGVRVRKSVTEGFQRTVSVPTDPFSASKRLPFTQTPSFISANDAMRDIFAQRAAKNASQKGSSSVPSSPQQHPKRAGPEEDESDGDIEDLDLTLTLDDDQDGATASAVRAKREAAAKLREEKAKREIRPLKRSASQGVGPASQSLPASMFRLPASMFRFSHEAPKPTPTVAKIAEEDDWSESFGGSGSVPTAEIEF